MGMVARLRKQARQEAAGAKRAGREERRQAKRSVGERDGAVGGHSGSPELSRIASCTPLVTGNRPSWSVR